MSVTWRQLPHFVLAMVLNFIVHELGHYAMGRALGYPERRRS